MSASGSDWNDSGSDWFDEEEFWRVSFPFMFPAERVETAEVEADEIIALTGCESGALLDMACGPGRHALAFARRGFRVTGVDATAFLLDKARERAKAEGLEVEWVESDMRGFVRPASYDLSTNLFTSFGFFEDPADNLAVLEHAHESLRPGGTLVLDVLGKEVLARKFQAMDAQESPSGELIVQRRRVFDDWTRISTEWMFVGDDRTKHFHLRLWIYSGAELRQMLFEAGFDAVELYGDFAGGPYDTEADRLIAVAGVAG
jgi:SAM-dependent methyltransferase